ncbi:MAG: hypothetical protein WD030_08610 [Pirellulales bacterium]
MTQLPLARQTDRLGLSSSAARRRRHACLTRRTVRLGLVSVVIAVIACSAATPVWARFAQPDLKTVPIERLQTNLQAAIEKSPDDANLRRNLARVYAMAFASKQENVEINNRDDMPWFGFTPKYIPFEVKATDDAQVKQQAEAALAAAIEQYQAALELDPDHLATQLGMAWALDQAGQDEEAKGKYRAVIETAWKQEGGRKSGRLGGNYLTVEAAKYLIPLLDPEQDGDEIMTLKSRIRKLRALPRPVTPIAIPLTAGLSAEAIHDTQAAVRFDADGTGLPHRWTWLNDRAAWLVYDAQGDGQITSATQLFGSATFMLFWENGYDALSTLDDNGDGRLAGAELGRLALWHDANANGVSEPGEVRPLSEYGIKSLDCGYERAADGYWRSPQGVVFEDSSSRPTFDIVLEPR